MAPPPALVTPRGTRGAPRSCVHRAISAFRNLSAAARDSDASAGGSPETRYGGTGSRLRRNHRASETSSAGRTRDDVGLTRYTAASTATPRGPYWSVDESDQPCPTNADAGLLANHAAAPRTDPPPPRGIRPGDPTFRVRRSGPTGQQHSPGRQHHGGARRRRVAVKGPAAARTATAAVAVVEDGGQARPAHQAEASGHARAAASVERRSAAIATSARAAGVSGALVT